MPSKIARCSGLTAVGATLLALFAAGPASAAVTTSQVTSPTSPYFTYYDSDSTDPQSFQVSGTSDGTTGDTVDIRCFYGNNNSTGLNADNVAVNADGTFSASVSKPSDQTCILRAVPSAGYSSSVLSRFAGPLAGFGYSYTYLNGTTPYDYDVDSATRKAVNYFYSASDCGYDYNYLLSADLDTYTGTWDCNAALYNYDSAAGSGSEIRLDGHNAYTATGAQYINGAADGRVPLSVQRSMNPATGEWTITESSPLLYCANADGSINDVPGYAGSSDCPKFATAPATYSRTITESHDGLLVTIADHFASTDGASHPLVTKYDNYQNGDTLKFPGESDYTRHGAGTIVDLGSAATGTIYTEYDDYYAPGQDNTQGALTYTTAPARAVFTSPNEFELEYDRTIPASGTLDLTHYYASGFTRESVQGLAAGVEDANGAPSVAISSPSSGAVTSSDAVTVIGTASDNVGVSSLTVNGIPTPVSGDGSWSQRVPLSAGANTITAVAKDASGQSSQAQVSVTYSPPSAPSCKVPAVVGQPSTAAANAIGSAGCTVGVTTAKPSKRAKGSVVSQSRSGGATLPAYFPIDLVVSSGPVGKAKLVTKKVSIKKGAVALQISCPKTSGNACNGTAKLRTVTTIGGAKRTLGTKAFQAPAGKKRTTTFVLSKANARRMKGRTIKAQLFIVFRDEDGKARTTKAALTIKG